MSTVPIVSLIILLPLKGCLRVLDLIGPAHVQILKCFLFLGVLFKELFVKLITRETSASLWFALRTNGQFLWRTFLSALSVRNCVSYLHLGAFFSLHALYFHWVKVFLKDNRRSIVYQDNATFIAELLVRLYVILSFALLGSLAWKTSAPFFFLYLGWTFLPLIKDLLRAFINHAQSLLAQWECIFFDFPSPDGSSLYSLFPEELIRDSGEDPDVIIDNALALMRERFLELSPDEQQTEFFLLSSFLSHLEGSGDVSPFARSAPVPPIFQVEIGEQEPASGHPVPSVVAQEVHWTGGYFLSRNGEVLLTRKQITDLAKRLEEEQDPTSNPRLPVFRPDLQDYFLPSRAPSASKP